MSGAADTVVATDLSKSYGGPPVLEHASLSIGAGEILVIMGRSGSGKSTLLKLIGGLDTPDSGSVLHERIDLAQMSEDERTLFRRRSLGFVFQFFNLIPTLTVKENVTLPLALNAVPAGESARRVGDLLDELGLGKLGSRLPDELSGGEQQRVAIARALVHEPRLVVADEPTGNLDAETASHTLSTLRASCRDRSTTLLMATHSHEAASIADRVLRLRGGRLEAA